VADAIDRSPATGGLTMSELHDVLTSDPGYRDHTAEVDRNRRKHENYTARRLRDQLAYSQARAAWHADYERAVDEGTEPPAPPPPPPEAPDLAGPIATEYQVLQDEWVRLRAKLAPRVRERAIQRQEELLEAAMRTPPAEWEPIRAELSSLAYTLKHVADDASKLTHLDDVGRPVYTDNTHRGDVTMLDLAVAVAARAGEVYPLTDDTQIALASGSVLELPPRPPTFTRRTDHDHAERTGPEPDPQQVERLAAIRREQAADVRRRRVEQQTGNRYARL
jgi:hypothetical protein